MYIPTTFFSNQGALIVSSGTAYTGSGYGASQVTTGYFVSSSQLWQYYYWKVALAYEHNCTDPASGSLTIFSGSTTQANLYVIAGGGGGGNCIGNAAAGGGGGGGIVRYSNFSLTPGTYQIYVGEGGCDDVDGNKGVNGKNSYILLPNGNTFTPFTSSYITAFGGGGGATNSSLQNTGSAGGSNGGNASGFTNIGAINSPNTLGIDLGGLNGLDQGNKAGNIPGFITASGGQTIFQYSATGGGGAGAASTSSYWIDYTTNELVTNGGDGLYVYMNPLSASYGLYWGAGGSGWGKRQYGGNYGPSNNGLGWGALGSGGRGASSPDADTKGYSGLIYIEWPVIGYQTNPYTTPNTLVSGGLSLYVNRTSLTGSVWYDKSGYDNNGLISGSALTSSSLGFNFNGIDNYVTFPSKLNATPTSSFTLQMYLSLPYITLNYSSQSVFLLNKYDYIDGWDTLWKTNTLQYIFRDAGGGAPKDPTWTNTFPPNFGNVLITYLIQSGSNTFQSGAINWITSSVNFNKTQNSFTASSQPLRFGYPTDGDGTWFTGSISDILIYDRILTQNEIISNYNYLSTNFDRNYTPTTTTTTTLAPVVADILVVGGGGGGSNATIGGSGGGAGGYVASSSITLSTTQWTPYNIIVGSGGAGAVSSNAPSNGTSSSLSGSGLYIEALGGGAAGWGGTYSAFPGQAGGSGGGGFSRVSIGAANGGAGTAGQGYAGGNPIAGNSHNCTGGGAGGAGTYSYYLTDIYGPSGSTWLDGKMYSYGGGTDAARTNIASGSGGGGGTAGKNGVVIVRYPGTIQRAEGGIITTSGSYTYHTFITSSQLIMW